MAKAREREGDREDEREEGTSNGQEERQPKAKAKKKDRMVLTKASFWPRRGNERGPIRMANDREEGK